MLKIWSSIVLYNHSFHTSSLISQASRQHKLFLRWIFRKYNNFMITLRNAKPTQRSTNTKPTLIILNSFKKIIIKDKNKFCSSLAWHFVCKISFVPSCIKDYKIINSLFRIIAKYVLLLLLLKLVIQAWNHEHTNWFKAQNKDGFNYKRE